ncbi:hypothetical protein [Solilutibacter silvestris]|uniref:hypothetical protein n=1 Tax=Solilutibacter silvestris TaxID=1645665 RepID=UPI003D33CF17
MNPITVRRCLVLSVSVGLVLAVSACGKKEAPTETAKPAAAAKQGQAPAAAAASTSATVAISAVDLGSAVGPDQTISEPNSTFAPGDTVYMAVTTNTSDNAATVPGKLAVRFVGPGNKVVHEENKDESFSGTGVIDFSLHDSKGLAPGRYQAEVSLNGGEAQIREFDVH